MTYGEQIREAARETCDWLRQIVTGVVIVPEAVKQVAGRKYDLLLSALEPVPEAPPDEREALAKAVDDHCVFRIPEVERYAIADAVLRAGWRRNPC